MENTCSISVGPKHGEVRLQPHPGDVLKSTLNVWRSCNARGLSNLLPCLKGLDIHRNDPQTFFVQVKAIIVRHATRLLATDYQLVPLVVTVSGRRVLLGEVQDP